MDQRFSAKKCLSLALNAADNAYFKSNRADVLAGLIYAILAVALILGGQSIHDEEEPKTS